MGFKRRSEWKATRDYVRHRDDFTCAYCPTRQTIGMTVDHIVPRKQGGTDAPDNLCCCCASCNSRKGHRRPDQAGMDCSHPVVRRRLQMLGIAIGPDGYPVRKTALTAEAMAP